MSGKTVMLAVQGEGRGHMTQALTLYQLLTAHGFDICCVVVGGNPERHQADFIKKSVSVPVVQVYSPYFIRRGDRGISLSATLFNVCYSFPRLVRSLRILHKLIKFHRPEMIIQCYEPLVALYRMTHSFSGQVFSVGHQYVYLHEAFRFPAGHAAPKWLLQSYTRFTAIGSDHILAISMYDMAPSRNRKLLVVPPMLRKEVLELSPTDEGYMLVYLVNAGYLKDIRAWSKAHPEVKIHCFTDISRINTDVQQHSEFPSLFIHALDARKFLTYLSGCSMLVSTAGFETVCEARYLGKGCYVVPVEGHFEQYCNARDAEVLGVASGHQFDLDRAFSLSMEKHDTDETFRRWVASCPDILLNFFRQNGDVREVIPVDIKSNNGHMHAISGGAKTVLAEIEVHATGVRASGS